MSQTSDSSVFPAFRTPPTQRQQPVHPEPEAGPQASPQPQPEPQQAQQAQPQSQQPQPQPPYYPPVAQRDSGMEKAYNDLTSAYEQQRQQIAELQKENDEYKRVYERASMYASIPDDYFDSMESIDAADARRISQVSIDAVQSAVEPIRRELEETRQLVAQRDAETKQRFEQERLGSLTRQVLSAHPDYFSIAQTPQYVNFINGRDGYSSQTRDQVAAQEFAAGNAAYVIDLINRFKAGNTSAQNIATVAPVQAASSYTGDVRQGEPKPSLTLHELNNLYQTGRIRYDDYIKEARRVKEAARVGA